MADYDFGALASPTKATQKYDFGELAKPVQAKPEMSRFEKAVDQSASLGVGETALNLGSGMLAGPVSGLAGIGAGIGKGLGMTNADPADVVRKVGSAMTYEPKTSTGKAISGAINKPFELLGQAGDAAGSYVAEQTGSPLAGAAVNTALQAAPMAAGKLLGKPAASRLANTETELAKQKALNAPRDENVTAMRDKGYVLPPSVTGNQGALTSFFQGIAGSTKMDYGASYKNQPVTNSLIKKELGIPEHEPISKSNLSDLRDLAGAAYENVKKAVPDLVVTKDFKDALQNPNSNFAAAKKAFPAYFKNAEINKMVSDLTKNPTFESEAAIQMQKKLRYDGYANLKAFDKPSQQALGEAQLNAAHAIDNLIDQNLNMKAPPGVNNFQSKLATGLAEARKKIAQSYAVENALNDTTGNVSAKTLGKLWEKQGTLTGGLKDVAQSHNAFPKAMRDVDTLPATANEKVSNLDVAKTGALAAMGHGTAAAVGALARPLVKPMLLSDWFQELNVKPPEYKPGLGTRLPAAALNNPAYPYMMIPRPPQEGQQ